MTFVPPPLYGTDMDALVAYDSSGEEDSTVEKRGDETPSIDPEESASILSKLKEKFSLESAPNVPNKVGNNWNRRITVCIN